MTIFFGMTCKMFVDNYNLVYNLRQGRWGDDLVWKMKRPLRTKSIEPGGRNGCYKSTIKPR